MTKKKQNQKNKNRKYSKNNILDLYEHVNTISLFYHTFNLPKEYNEKLFEEIFTFAQSATPSKAFVKKGHLWGKQGNVLLL